MKYLNLEGLAYFFNKCKALFATSQSVADFKADTDMYVTDVDYSEIAFDTKEFYTELLT